MSVDLLDDTVDGRETEAGAFALFFGGEEGLEDAFLGFGVDAGAGVLEAEDKVGLGVHVVREEKLRLIHFAAYHGELHLSAVRHGVAGVCGEVDEDLLEGGPVDVYENRGVGEAEVVLDVFRDEATQDFLHVAGDLDGVEHLRLEVFVSPGEGEELLGEVGGAFGGLADLGDELAVGVAVFDLVDDEVGEGEDDGEDVVEVVGDASGEASDGFHLLGLEEVLLEASQVGDVSLDDDVVGDLAFGAMDGEGFPGDDEFGSVFFVADGFSCCGLAGEDVFDHLVDHRLVGGGAVENGDRLADDFYVGVAGDLSEAVVGVEDAGIA